eukprot:scaffold709029_cov63-Attheya_sp.AAC.5
MKYCSTVGLVVADILPKPPFWESACIKAAYAMHALSADVKVTGTKIKLISERIGGNGEKVKETKEVIFFDLSDDCNDIE